MKQKFITLVVITFFIFGLATILQAQQQSIRPVQKLKTPLKIMAYADPYIYVVCVKKGCFCQNELNKVDAILARGIAVVVGNNYCAGKKKAFRATGEVKVSYYDLNVGKTLSETLKFSVDPGHEQTLIAFPGFRLAKKSIGFTAKIVKIDLPILDCNLSNNSQTRYTCMSCAVVK